MSAQSLLDDFSALEDCRRAWKAGHELQVIPLAVPVLRDISLLLLERSWTTCEGCNFGRWARHKGLAFHRVHA